MKTIYSDKELSKYNVTNLLKIANEELGLNLEGTLTKAQLKKAIKANQGGDSVIAPTGDVVVTSEVPQPEISEKAPEKRIVTVPIWDCKEGDIVRYVSSNKVYKVAKVVREEGKKPYILLVSATQKFRCFYSFEAQLLLQAEEYNEASYTKLLEKYKSNKNVPFAEFEAIVAETIENDTPKKAEPKATEDNPTPEAATEAPVEENTEESVPETV